MKWIIEIKHDELNEHRIIRGDSKYWVEEEARKQLKVWDEKWLELKPIIEKERMIERKISEAKERTKAAEKKIPKINNFLKNSLSTPKIVWEDGKEYLLFIEPQPKPEIMEFTKAEPAQSDFSPKIGLLEKRNKEKVQIKIEKAKEEYQKALNSYNNKLSAYKASNKKYNMELEEWKNSEKNFYENQNEYNKLLDKNKLDYDNKNTSVISELCRIVLKRSYYIEGFPEKFAIDFNEENRILIVDFTLPIIENLPFKEVKYDKTKNVFAYTYFSDTALKKIYDDLIYQIVLSKINDLYKADYHGIIESIVFNGWVDTIDRGTGKDITLCILSIQTSKEEFLSLDLKRVDPKECFRKLKGVGSTKLHTITPIAPILEMDKKDKRFISSYNVIDGLDDSENLALMDWEDFEHLIREIFEKEFSQNGGEVKVTQSSRDGGVDAIAFDPDPIRGGKIVIQAKRYTNIVGVSAVRDLFGTIMNEGATKGILVTTANFGSDAYDFAKGKPITLLNGSNLLNLLEKHGQKAKIDLKEARRILDQNK